MRRWTGCCIALLVGAGLALALAVTASARPTTFAWDAHPDWPGGTTVELCGNGDVCLDGITGTQATLDLPVQPGDVIEGRARAVAPAGYQCGNPPEPCPYSDWATVAQTWPADQIGVWGRYEREEVTPMAAEVISGTATGITFQQATATPASVNVDVPSDATAAYVFWQYFSSSASDGVSAATLGGTAYSQKYDHSGAADYYSNGVIAFYSPSTGTRALSITWSSTPGAGDGGPSAIIVFTKGGDTSAWRDADATSGGSSASVTLTTESNDLVLADDGHYGISPPSNPSGWTSLATFVQLNSHIRARSIVASGTSQQCVSSSSNYPTITAIAIPAASADTATILSFPASALDLFAQAQLTISSVLDNALSSDISRSGALSSFGISDNALSSDIYAAIASAVSSVLDNASSADQGPSYAAAIAAIIDAAIANASINSELIGAQLTEILDSSSASDLFGPIAAAFLALRDGALAGDSWVSGAQAVAGFIEAAQAGDSAAITALARIVGAETAIAADAKGQQAYAQAVLSELAQADLSLVLTSLADNEVLISESSQALDAFVSAAQALARLSDTATALDAALAIVAASAAISDAATAGDVYGTFVGGFASVISGSALAGDQYQGTQTALAAIVEDAIVSMVLRSSALSVNRLDEAVAAIDGWQSIMGDSYRTITDASVAGDLIASRVTGYVAIVEAVAASAALYARAGSQIALSAMAIAGDRFEHTPVAEAVLQRLVVASIAISKALSGQVDTSTRLAGSVDVYH